MNPAHTTFGRLSVVLVSLFAWFAISNHCALATLLAPVAAVHASCHGDQGASGDKPTPPAGEDAPCCKTLRATVADVAKVLPAQIFIAPPPMALLPGVILFPPQTSPGIFGDTGPPRISFAEQVLQRSVLAHAPPLFA